MKQSILYSLHYSVQQCVYMYITSIYASGTPYYVYMTLYNVHQGQTSLLLYKQSYIMLTVCTYMVVYTRTPYSVLVYIEDFPEQPLDGIVCLFLARVCPNTSAGSISFRPNLVSIRMPLHELLNTSISGDVL